METEIKVLDHGYVKFISSMGTDQTIIEAARMSTGKGFQRWDAGEFVDEEGNRKQVPGDAKLLSYLYQNGHMTPFEMCELHLEVQAPIMVFREWHRHRTQCLAGDTLITCVSPRGATYKCSIEEIFGLKHGGVVDSAPVLPNCQNRTLRVLDEDLREFTTAEMADVWESGEKELFLLKTVEGFSVRASAEHPFFTKRGWVKMKDIQPGDCVARLGKIANTDTEQPCREGVTRRGVRWEKVDKKPQSAGVGMTYDIEVIGPHHNYVANDLVVHNSFNEFSARYAQMPNLHYVPERERFQKQGVMNKQGSAEPIADELAELFRSLIESEQESAYANYDRMVMDGLAKEVARVNTPISRYSKMRVKADLRNWLGFLNLRLRPNAQAEIRAFAQAVEAIISRFWPRTYELFLEYDLHGAKLSRTEAMTLFRVLGDAQSDQGSDDDAAIVALRKKLQGAF